MLDRLGLHGHRAEIRPLKHHLGSRCTLQLDVGRERIALKVYADDPSPLADLLSRFAHEGLATGRAPTVPPLLIFDPELRVIATGWLYGPSGKELIARGAGERTAEIALAWLHTASSFPIELGDTYGPQSLLRDTAKRVQLLAGADPQLGSLATLYYERLASDAPPDASTNLRHASFKPSSMIDVGGPGLIDWDGFRQGAPELEAAGFLASLSRMAKSAEADEEPLRRSERTFREGMTGLVETRALSWYLTAELIKLAARLARRRPRRWHERASGLLHDAGVAMEQLP